jgi:hypothetical protein
MKIRGWVALLAFAGLSAAFAADKVETVPLKLELPKPAYEGTPKNITADIPLEPVTGKPRPEIQVPKGTALLSLSKKVTSSDDDPVIGKLKYITNGDKDGAEGSWVELGPGLQWVQIDLENAAKIEAIAIWHFHRDPRVFRCVVVQVSDDPDFIKGVTTVFNNDQKNDSGLGVGTDKGYLESNEGKLIKTDGVKGRYVRLYSKGNTADDDNEYTEVEVWGSPAAAAAPAK